MYSETIERLIQSVIADGEISEKERAVLHKKAEAEGIDVDELDVYIDGLVVQQRNSASQASRFMGPAKQGVITKCPNCGAVVEAGAVKCEECGYVFRGVEANSSSQKLADKLFKIEEEFRDKKIGPWGLDTQAKCYQEKVTAVQSFPVPTTKEDLWEFIINMRSRYENQRQGAIDPLKNAYKAKYDECITKAKLMFPNDPQFQPLFENQLKPGRTGKIGCFGVVLLAVITIVAGLMLL